MSRLAISLAAAVKAFGLALLKADTARPWNLADGDMYESRNLGKKDPAA